MAGQLVNPPKVPHAGRMPTPPFVYQDPLPLGPDDTAYRLLSREGVSTSTFEGREILKIAPAALAYLAR